MKKRGHYCCVFQVILLAIFSIQDIFSFSLFLKADISGILQGIKGASAREINKLTGVTAKSSIGASSATSRKTPQDPDCATTRIGAIKASQASLLSALGQKDNVKGRQECLPHLHTRFLAEGMGMQGRFANRPCGMVDVDGIWIVVGATLVVALSLRARTPAGYLWIKDNG